MALYLDSSAVLAVVVDGKRDIGRLLRGEQLIASMLTVLEVNRVLNRAEALGELDANSTREAARDVDELFGDTELYAVDDQIIARAGRRFPIEPVRSLDAIHLATAEAVNQQISVAVLSLDKRLRENAVALGLEVVPRKI